MGRGEGEGEDVKDRIKQDRGSFTENFPHSVIF